MEKPTAPTNRNKRNADPLPGPGRPRQGEERMVRVGAFIDPACLESIPGNRSEFIRQAIAEKLERDGLCPRHCTCEGKEKPGPKNP